MSSRMAAAGGARPGAPASPPPPTLAARHGDRPPPFNLLLTSAVLGGVLAAVCAACYCCGRASRARKPRESSHSSNIYTLSTDCPHNYSLFHDISDSDLPFRRPPTPGPPPAYDSVVSSTDKLRRFGIDDDYIEDADKFERYAFEGSTGPDELGEIVISGGRLDALNYCTIRRGCMDRFDARVNSGDASSAENDDENTLGGDLTNCVEEVSNSEHLRDSVESIGHTRAERDGAAELHCNGGRCSMEGEIEQIHSTCTQKKTGILKTRFENPNENFQVIDEALPTYEAATCIEDVKMIK